MLSIFLLPREKMICLNVYVELNGSETWVINKREERYLESFEM
jgi:hypothetical protein